MTNPEATPAGADEALHPLAELYLVQQRLNDLTPFATLTPQQRMHRVRIALVAELAEVIDALKPSWAWWRKDGDAHAIDLDTVLEEITDVWFFLLTLLHLHLSDPDMQEEYGTIDEQLAFVSGLGTYLEETVAVSVRDGLAAVEQELGHAPTSDEQAHGAINGVFAILELLAPTKIGDKDVVETAINLYALPLLLGMSESAFLSEYLRKARVNVRRWFDANLTISEDAEFALALLDDLEQRLAATQEVPA